MKNHRHTSSQNMTSNEMRTTHSHKPIYGKRLNSSYGYILPN